MLAFEVGMLHLSILWEVVYAMITYLACEKSLWSNIFKK